ncbi:uncharacterized protein OCT59_018504 [Rhizophagus irregularis]|uniref:uncharacterized protein n=1 Tax=Rhizophagus irregularis TaxID=588596 RepID=UPI003329EFF7|nr:hypothetical protein OCT59_018504 [Rhizophagus irregularis]
MTRKKPSKPNTPPPNIAESSTPAPQNIATSSTPTPPNIATSTLASRSSASASRNIASSTPASRSSTSASRNITTSSTLTPQNIASSTATAPNIATSSTPTPPNIATSTPASRSSASASRNIASSTRNITTSSTLSTRNITTSSTLTPQNTNTTVSSSPFKLVILPDISASIGRTQSQSQRNLTASDIIKKYPNINVPKSYRSHHEEGAPRSDRPSNEEAGNFELGNLKKETLRLQNELKQEKSKVARMKRKIDNLEDHVRRIEEENSMLRDFNEIFSNESNELCEENKALREELQQSKQLHIPRKIINPPQQYSPKRPNKRLKSREESPDEVAATDARAEMKNLLKGQIPEEYRLDYGKTFSEQTAKIYEKLIPELKKLMSGHYNPSKKNRRVKAAIKLYERNNANIQEFDKDELLPMLLQNDCHSIEQSDSEDESRQKLPNNKRFLHVYDREWRSNKNAPEWALDKAKMYETDETNETNDVSEYDVADDVIDDLIQSYEDCEPMEPNLTEPYSDFLLNSAEMNSIRPEDLDEIGESSTTQQRAERSRKGKEKATKEAKEDEKIYEIFEADEYY